MPDDSPGNAPGSDPLDAVEALAAQFLVRLQAGEEPDRQAILQLHPQLADRLQQRLAHVELVYRRGLDSAQNASAAPTSAGIATDASEPAIDVTPPPLGSESCEPRRVERGNPPGYEIVRELGHGGMGVVYLARQKSLNRLVALKMIASGIHASPPLRARFHVEAEALARLQHPNIVQVYEVGEHQGCPFMALEYVDGGNLGSYLARRPQPPRQATSLIETLARAIHVAHQQGIVHRDLKPANILLMVEGGGWRVEGNAPPSTLHPPPFTPHPPPSTVHPKITDFGLAKRLAEGDGQTSTGVILGTPSYMAPEQAAGRVHDTGPATDVYALGAILYELLTGKPPFSDASALSTLKRVEAEEPTAPSRLRTGLPRDLETICLKCLAKEPARRYATALDLAEDLRRFVDGKPITARAVGRAERTWKWIKRRPTLAALIGLSLVVTCLLAAMDVSWTLQVRAERDRTRSSLRVARHAIDGLYTQMATERLFDEPGLDPLCQELLEKAQQYYEELTQQHNNDPDVRRDVGLAWFRLGETRRLRGQPEQAAQAYEKAIAVQEPLCEADPSNPGFREDLANSHNWLGELLREHGRPALESERHYQAALTLQQELVQSFPAEPLYRMEMARSFYNLGIIAKDTNRRHEASADYDRAVTLLRALIAADPKPVNVRQDLARALVDRGVLQRLMGRPEEARRDYEQSIKLLSELRTELPSRAVYKFDLAIARQDLGNLLCSQHRFDEAQHEEQASLTLLRGLVADFSTRPRYRKKLGNAFDNLGTAFALAGQRKDAERSWLQALTLFEGLTREYPTTADYHDLLGMTLGNLGWLRTEQKNWPEARRLIERAIAEVQAALQPNALKPEYRQELRDLHQDLAETLVQLGDHAAAVRVAAKLARIFPERAQDSYYAACFVARCVPLAGADKPTTERYIEIALALLRRAADQATPALKRLPDERRIFQPLTSHAAWQATIRDLNAKVAGAKSSS